MLVLIFYTICDYDLIKGLDIYSSPQYYSLWLATRIQICSLLFRGGKKSNSLSGLLYCTDYLCFPVVGIGTMWQYIPRLIESDPERVTLCVEYIFSNVISYAISAHFTIWTGSHVVSFWLKQSARIVSIESRNERTQVEKVGCWTTRVVGMICQLQVAWSSRSTWQSECIQYSTIGPSTVKYL